MILSDVQKKELAQKRYLEKKKSSTEKVKYLQNTMKNMNMHSFYESSQRLVGPYTNQTEKLGFYSGEHSMKGEEKLK